MSDPSKPHPRFELFHQLGDPACSRVRTRVVELGLEPVSEFRNISFDSHRAAFEAHQGRLLPSIWDGAHLFEGEVACQAYLSGLPREGASAES
jgi:hypothetical protein